MHRALKPRRALESHRTWEKKLEKAPSLSEQRPQQCNRLGVETNGNRPTFGKA